MISAGLVLTGYRNRGRKGIQDGTEGQSLGELENGNVICSCKEIWLRGVRMH